MRKLMTLTGIATFVCMFLLSMSSFAEGREKDKHVTVSAKPATDSVAVATLDCSYPATTSKIFYFTCQNVPGPPVGVMIIGICPPGSEIGPCNNSEMQAAAQHAAVQNMDYNAMVYNLTFQQGCMSPP